MEAILKYRNKIYGFCALWILLFHIASRIPVNLPLLGPAISQGNFAVDVFLLLSGYCVAASYGRDPDRKRFYSKRLQRVVLPYLFFYILFYLWKYLVRSPCKGPADFLKHYVLGLSTGYLWLRGTTTAWFAAAIMLFYLTFPLFYARMRKSRKGALAVLGLMYLANLAGILLLYRYYKVAAIVWTRWPIFLWGAFVQLYGEELHPPKWTKLAAVGWFLLLTFILPVKELIKTRLGLPNCVLWLCYGTMVPGALLSLELLFRKTERAFPEKGLLAKIGGLSLEIYFIHTILLSLSDFYGVTESLSGWLYLAVPLCSVLLTFAYGAARSALRDRLKNQ